MRLPFLSRRPGPTAMTVASGRGLFVADVGRKMPVAVFCSGPIVNAGLYGRKTRTYCLSLEPLDENAVKQRNDSLDGLECRLSSLKDALARVQT